MKPCVLWGPVGNLGGERHQKNFQEGIKTDAERSFFFETGGSCDSGTKRFRANIAPGRWTGPWRRWTRCCSTHRRISRPARPAWPCTRCPRVRPWLLWCVRGSGPSGSAAAAAAAVVGAAAPAGSLSGRAHRGGVGVTWELVARRVKIKI